MNRELSNMTARIATNAILSLAFGAAWIILLVYVAGAEARLAVSSQQILAFVSGNITLIFFAFGAVEAVIFAFLATILVLMLHPRRLLLNGLSAIAPFVVITFVSAATLEAKYWNATTSTAIFYPLVITIILYVTALWMCSLNKRQSS